MATKKKMLEAAAGSAGGAGLDITEVFSTYLYTGTGSAQTITNGIDLAGEGGLVWQKSRENADDHRLSDTERGVNKTIRTNNTGAEFDVTGSNSVSQFNSNGFESGLSDAFFNGEDIASWTFRKAEKFFDCVTYTGVDTSGAGRTIAHNLGSVPGTIIIKRTDSTSNWPVYHRSTGNTGMLQLNKTNSFYAALNIWNNTSPTDTEFTISDNGNVNSPGGTYVAYLFAHNNSDGEFGPDSDQDIIKCGSYTGNESSFPTVDLGFEPQFLLLKNATASGEGWLMMDTTREWLADGNNPTGDFKSLRPYNSGTEGGSFFVNITSTGFELTAADAEKNSNGNTFIYMAIRRGPLAPPTAGTEVFGLNAYTGNTTSGRIIDVGFPVDLGIIKNRTPGGDTDNLSDRLRGPNKFLTATASNAENTSTNNVIGMDNMEGFEVGSDTQVNYTGSGYGPYIMWGWKRAPSYFDAVCYSGNSTAGRTVSHNLGVAPEMMWIKPRDLAYQWSVYHKDVSSSSPYYELKLNSNDALADSNNTNAPFAGVPTATTIPLPSGTASASNRSGYNYIAYLFASLAGVSKVGSYTGNQTNEHQINCGFATGARFVLAKKTSGSGDWYVFDSARGITTNYDPWLGLNSTDEEVSSDNIIRPFSSGFALGSGGQLNESGATYIFYAIA